MFSLTTYCSLIRMITMTFNFCQTVIFGRDKCGRVAFMNKHEVRPLVQPLASVCGRGDRPLHRKPLRPLLLWGNRGGLLLTSVRVMFTVVVPERPPIWPPMSLAWITTWYCSLFSLLMSGNAVFIMPFGKVETSFIIQSLIFKFKLSKVHFTEVKHNKKIKCWCT